MMADPITLTFGILGAGIQLVKVIGNVQHVISSKEEARELKRQLRCLYDTIDEVKDTLRRLGGLVPRKLSDIIHALGRYCRQLGEDIAGFHLRFRNKGSFRFMNWVAMTAGFNKIERYRDRLEDCEDWYNIALKTLHLTVSQQVRARSPSNLPTQLTEQDILQGTRETQSRILLRQHLGRVRRAGSSRYKRMKRARIDLSGLRHLAEDVLDDSTTVATSSTSSLPETQRSPPRNHPWPHYHQSSAQRRTRREVPETVPVVVQDFVYRQPSPERHPQRPRGNRYPHYHDQPEQPVQEPIGMQMPQRPRGIGGESLCPEPHTLPPIPRPQPQRNEPRPRQYHDHSELPPRRPIATQTARQIVPVIAHDAAYNHQPLSLRRRDDVPLRDHPIRERGAIQQPPPPSNLPQVDRTQQSSMRGRPRSIHQDSSGHGLPLPPGHRRHAASSLPIDEHSTAGRESIRRPPPQNYHPRQDQRPRYTSSRSRSHSVDHESVAEGVVQPTRHQRLAADAVPIRLHPTPERVATRPPPPTSHHPREDLRQHHSSTRSRSRSIDYCSGAEDVLQPPKHRRPDVNDRKYPPNAFKDPEAKPQKLRKRSRSRSDSGYGSVSGRSSDAEESGSMRSRSGSSSLSREYGPRYESSRPSECGSLLPEDHPRERRHSRRRSVRE